MTAYVKKIKCKKSIVPSWQGGRMPLSANLGKKLRHALDTGLKLLKNRSSTIEEEMFEELEG
jgi:ATP-dependent Lhr-like helicase